MSTILYLKLDETNDPNFDLSAVLEDLEAVQQAILTRLLLFQGEWFENLDEGLPLFQKIVGYKNQQAAALAITARVIGTPFVSGVKDVSVSNTNRQLSYAATAQTVFGQAQVTATPGAAAVIGS